MIPDPGGSPGVGNGNPLQYSCLENPMDRGAWQATVHRVTESHKATEQVVAQGVTMYIPGGPCLFRVISHK